VTVEVKWYSRNGHSEKHEVQTTIFLEVKLTQNRSRRGFTKEF